MKTEKGRGRREMRLAGRGEKGECVSGRTGSIAITDTACYFPPIFIRSIKPISSLISSSGME